MSSLSEWIGAQDLRGASMGLDDPAIDDRTAALEKRQEVLMTRSEKLDAVVAATQKALAEARGVGESESGAVKVTVDAQNRVVDVALAAAGLASSLKWMMTSFIVMQRQRRRRRRRGHGPLTTLTLRKGSRRPRR